MVLCLGGRARRVGRQPWQTAHTVPGQRENTAIGTGLLGAAQSAGQVHRTRKKHRPALVGAGKEIRKRWEETRVPDRTWEKAGSVRGALARRAAAAHHRWHGK